MNEKRVMQAEFKAAEAKENYYQELTNALAGTTTKNLMCPSCGYLKEKTVRNIDRSYVLIVWRCPCGKLNHTKIATEKPLYLRLGEE